MSLKPKDMSEAKRFIVQLEGVNKKLQLKLDKQKDTIEEQLSIIKIAKGTDIPTTDMFTRYARLEIKLDEQIAYSEALKKHLTGNPVFLDWKTINTLLSQSPAQSLNKLKADVVREASSNFQSLNYDIPGGLVEAQYVATHLEEYASQLLKEGK